MWNGKAIKKIKYEDSRTSQDCGQDWGAEGLMGARGHTLQCLSYTAL